MPKRVYELAKELDLSSREVIAALAGLGFIAKSHSSTVENENRPSSANRHSRKKLHVDRVWFARTLAWNSTEATLKPGHALGMHGLISSPP